MAYSTHALEFLRWAAHDLEKAKGLLEQHPKILKSRSGTGETALHYLAIEDCAKGVELLLGHGADVNTKDKFGYTPLHSAVMLGNVEVVKLLLSHDADLEGKNHLGDTPLMIAREKKLTQLSDLLKSAGAREPKP